jgi:hypothetical protein
MKLRHKPFTEEMAIERKAQHLRWRLKSKYGITIEQRDAMFDKQGGVCRICGALPPPDRYLHIDHNHTTGQVRGLLCYTCNVNLSWYERNAANVQLHLATPILDQTPSTP